VGGYAQAVLLPLVAGATLSLGRCDTDRRVAPIFRNEAINRLAYFVLLALALSGARRDRVWRLG
jgi:hypothetical protein